MFKKGSVISLKLPDKEFVGIVDHHDRDCIELKDVCSLRYQAGTSNVSFNQMKCDLVFYRQQMIIMTLDEDHGYYKAYKQAVSGIILPGRN